jgi:hypothetical protein
VDSEKCEVQNFGCPKKKKKNRVASLVGSYVVKHGKKMEVKFAIVEKIEVRDFFIYWVHTH